jgi:hypothetical protein
MEERGRPQKRRADENEEDAEIKGVSNSRTVTKDQKDWRRIVLEGLGTQQTAMHETEKIQKVCFHTTQPYSPINACGVIFRLHAGNSEAVLLQLRSWVSVLGSFVGGHRIKSCANLIFLVMINMFHFSTVFIVTAIVYNFLPGNNLLCECGYCASNVSDIT